MRRQSTPFLLVLLGLACAGCPTFSRQVFPEPEKLSLVDDLIERYGPPTVFGQVGTYRVYGWHGRSGSSLSLLIPLYFQSVSHGSSGAPGGGTMSTRTETTVVGAIALPIYASLTDRAIGAVVDDRGRVICVGRRPNGRALTILGNTFVPVGTWVER